jgi:hypothetical protein
MLEKTKLALNCFASGLSIAWVGMAIYIKGDNISVIMATGFLLFNVALAALAYKNIKE